MENAERQIGYLYFTSEMEVSFIEYQVMNINNIISYLPASKDPLSADVFQIKAGHYNWFFDVGRNDTSYEMITKEENKGIIISHFHPDHMENLIRILDFDRLTGKETKLFVGDNTYKYTKTGEIVADHLWIEDGCKLHIFPLPSSHAKGSLGLEINEEYALLGDGTYSTQKNGNIVYNVQILREEIKVLEGLKAQYFCLSHQESMVQTKEQILKQLYRIYEKRQKNEPYIILK